MTAKCANPDCSQPFHYFRTGRIYLIDIPNGLSKRSVRKAPEYFWLCGECCRSWRVVVNHDGVVVVEPSLPQEAVA